MVKKKLQFSSNGPPFYLVCSRPLFRAPGLHSASGYWGSLCHTGCSAGGVLQFAEQNVWFFAWFGFLELDTVDMVRLQLLPR